MKKVEISTPLLFIDSDNRRFVIAKLDEQDMTATIEFAVFSDDSIILSLVSLLTVDMKRRSTLKTRPRR